MSERSPGITLTAASPQFVDTAPESVVDDWLSYANPDVVVLTGSDRSPLSTMAVQQRTEVTVVDAGDPSTSGTVIENGDTQLFVATAVQDLCHIGSLEDQGLNVDYPTFLLGNYLSLEVDTTALETTLVGIDDYRANLHPSGLKGEYVHLSTELPMGYRREWDGMVVVGIGEEPGVDDSPLMLLECQPEGEVLRQELDPSNFGLTVLDGVGPKRAEQLRSAGIAGPANLRETDSNQLTSLRGIGRTTAEKITSSAQAVAAGEVVKRSEEQLPTGEPLYIDIETDGLSPTICWLIGVLDGSAADGRYMAFLQKDPEKPGEALQHFLSWYRANASGRPLVAYHGWEFDFPVLYDQIIDHCPSFEDVWSSTYRFDPYQWAVKDGNAILPGRTNKLEDVAAALGYERAEAGLSGGAVARRYRQWMASESDNPEAAPNWERFKRYCEDDVRALATVYEALEAAGRIESDVSRGTNVSETTEQQRLSDW